MQTRARPDPVTLPSAPPTSPAPPVGLAVAGGAGLWPPRHWFTGSPGRVPLLGLLDPPGADPRTGLGAGQETLGAEGRQGRPMLSPNNWLAHATVTGKMTAAAASTSSSVAPRALAKLCVPPHPPWLRPRAHAPKRGRELQGQCQWGFHMGRLIRALSDLVIFGG